MDAGRALIQPFPMPCTPVLIRAFDNLYLAAEGTEKQKKALGNPANLPKPWDPGTIVDPQLRYETWLWLDDVVTWFNHEHVWNLHAGHIPACWPHHPHLVHDIAVLADLRRQASMAASSQPLEEWHRYAVPGFLERMKQRLNDCCDTGHTDWPGRARNTRHQTARSDRLDAYEADCQHVADNNPGWDDLDLEPDEAHDDAGDLPAQRSGLRLVPRIDPQTGEIIP